jgi:predicted transcriptional regulator of viral defense system
MKTSKALALSLGEQSLPVVTEYQLGLLIYRLYDRKEFRGESLNLQKTEAEGGDYRKYRDQLLSEGVLSEDRQLPSGVFTILGAKSWSPEDVACLIDPFSYVSHLSAMEYHGLTDRIPAKLFLSSPENKDWKTFAEEKMRKELGESYQSYCGAGLPVLRKIKLSRVGKKEVHRSNSRHLGAFKNVRGRHLRVSTIGRTFLDMLRQPQLCGGINHVIDVFKEHGEAYLRLIVNEFESHGKKIDKIRAGYILDELVKVDDAVVKSWQRLAQRGGSQKLDASGEYIPEWSDRWCLSINN